MNTRQQCEALYRAAFGESPDFDRQLFDSFFDCVEFLEIESVVAAMFFKIPCTLKTGSESLPAYYLYAVTTHSDFRRQGLMSRLFSERLPDGTFCFLKPSSEGVQKFYSLQGFKKLVGTPKDTDNRIIVSDKFEALSSLCDKPSGSYTLMAKGGSADQIETLGFKYTLE